MSVSVLGFEEIAADLSDTTNTTTEMLVALEMIHGSWALNRVIYGSML